MQRTPALLFAVALVAAACSSTDAKVTHSRLDKLPYPSQIYVYDFAVSPREVSADSVASARLAGATDDPTENPQREQLEHQVAAVLADRLVEDLKDLNLPAVRWHGPIPDAKDAYTIEGQFVTIDEGNALQRMIIGFGVGGTELKVLVQAYRLYGTQRFLLGEAEVSSESSGKPGLAATLPVGAAISGIGTAAAINTGIGVVTELNTDVKEAAEDTAEAIVELLEPRMEEQGWLD